MYRVKRIIPYACTVLLVALMTLFAETLNEKEIILRLRKTVWNGHLREPVTDYLMKKDPELYELGAVLARIV